MFSTSKLNLDAIYGFGTPVCYSKDINLFHVLLFFDDRVE